MKSTRTAQDSGFGSDKYNMERRAEMRFDIDQPARLKVLDGTDAAAIAGRIANVSSTGLALKLEEAVVPGTAVRVDCGEALFLGEVRYCRLEGTAFSTGLHVDHAVYDVSGLAALAHELLEEQAAPRINRAASA